MDSQNNPDSANADRKLLRLVRPSVVVLCGPAGCGKSTFAEQHFRSTQIISSDWARGRVSDDERDQRSNVQAFALVHFLVEQRLTLNRLCVIDSTALAPQDRKELINLAKKYQVPTTLLLFSVPLQTCIERDEKRERTVGRSIVVRQYRAFELSKETIHREGFDQVVEVEDGDQEKVQIEILFRPVARGTQRPGPGATRKLDRTVQPSRLGQAGPRASGHSLSTMVAAPVTRTAADPRLVDLPGPTPPPNTATPRGTEIPAPVVRAEPPMPAHPPASPGIANPPNLHSTTLTSSKPSPATALQTPPRGDGSPRSD